MGGKSKKATVGYWYHPAFHMGISLGPIDALLEIRGGDQTAWAGALTASGTITINQPNLWGGEKDQGGIVGDLDVMFGEATQQPNAYLTATFGNQQPAWRGLTSIVFKGGRYGAMNPYPQKISYKGSKITKGWDGDICWYPAKAAVPVGSNNNGVVTITNFTGGFSTNAPTKFQILAGGAIANTGVNASGGNQDYWRAPIPFSGLVDVYFEFQLLTLASGDPITMAVTDQAGSHVLDFNPRTEDVVDGQSRPAINYWGALTPILPNALAANTLYSFEATINRAANQYTYWLRQGSTVLSTGTSALGGGAPAYLTFARTSNSGASSIAECSLVRMSGGTTAMNPAHILYYARTQQHMGREPIANMDDASHQTAADWFYSQGFGLCADYDPSQESVDAFIQRIEKVSGCSQSRSPVDGKWYLDIANGVYDLNSLPILTDDDILDFQRQPTTLDSAVNSVSVQYFEPQAKTNVTTPPVQALALVNEFGTIHQDVTYNEIPLGDLASRVALRDLKGFVTPTNGFEITAARKPYAWRRGTYFRLQTPKRGIADMVCILGDIDTGTLKSGAIKITATQDIYGLPSASFVQQEPGVDTRPPQIPLAIVTQKVFEAPYFELVRTLSRADLNALTDDVGYLMTVAQDPATSRGYGLDVSTDGGTTYTDNATGVFCPTALIVEGDARVSGNPATAFTLSGGTLLASVVVGSAALWESEVCRVDAIDPVAGTLTLARGCADTPAAAHAANSRIWFFDGFTGTDAVEYTSGETIQVKLLTVSGSGQLDPSVVAAVPLTFNERQARPYPAAGLTINGVVYPAGVVVASPGNIPVAWVERNRVTQADQLIDTTAATVAAEAGTTYTLRTYLNGSLVNTQTGVAAVSANIAPGAFGNVRVEIDSVRGGISSWQPLAWTFQYQSALVIATASPIQRQQGAAGTFQLQANGGVTPYTWSVDAATPLPTGMTMDSSGLVTDGGTAPIGDTTSTFTVTDALGSTATKSITISVASASFVGYIDTLTPVAHWRMGDPVGSTYLNDRIANEHATLSGTYTLGVPGMVSGDGDTAVQWTSGKASTGASAKWALGTGDCSMLMIAKWTSGTFATMACLRDSGASNILGMFTINRTKVGDVETENWDWNNTKVAATDKAYNDGSPHVLIAAFEAATKTLRLYVDGTLKGSKVCGGTRPTATTMLATIGSNVGGTQYIPATLDEFVCFNKLLTDADAANLSSLALTGAVPP